MSLFADVFFVGSWDPEIGGRRVETRLQKGDPIPEAAFARLARCAEEVLAIIFKYGRSWLSITYAYAASRSAKTV